jgi:DNA-binding NarL/FixJ family response regulator
MKTETTVLIADDHPIFRNGLRQIIERNPMLKFAGEAGDGRTALNLLEVVRPDVAVVDINMPEMGGLELAQQVRDRNLIVHLIFLTMYKDEIMFNAAMDAGAKGYLLKDDAILDLAECIRTVMTGRHYITPSLSSFLINRSRRSNDFIGQTPGLDSLTKTERRVLRFIAEDKTSKEIGEILFIHPRTVDNHRTNICQKLNLRGSHALVRFALKHHSEIFDE